MNKFFGHFFMFSSVLNVIRTPWSLFVFNLLISAFQSLFRVTTLLLYIDFNSSRASLALFLQLKTKLNVNALSKSMLWDRHSKMISLFQLWNQIDQSQLVADYLTGQFIRFIILNGYSISRFIHHFFFFHHTSYKPSL